MIYVCIYTLPYLDPLEGECRFVEVVHDGMGERRVVREERRHRALGADRVEGGIHADCWQNIICVSIFTHTYICIYI